MTARSLTATKRLRYVKAAAQFKANEQDIQSERVARLRSGDYGRVEAELDVAVEKFTSRLFTGIFNSKSRIGGPPDNQRTGAAKS